MNAALIKEISVFEYVFINEIDMRTKKESQATIIKGYKPKIN